MADFTVTPEESLKVFHLHGETVLLADHMQLLASGKFCPTQVVRIGANAYGIQCHFELTAEMLENWMNEDEDLLKTDKENLNAIFRNEQPEYLRTGRQLMINFLKTAGY
ncbi:MAG: hypothetical protein WCI48_00845 [Bacteroidota bacterium]|jgi:GMP synthase (glutamine-hydrolysing)